MENLLLFLLASYVGLVFILVVFVVRTSTLSSRILRLEQALGSLSEKVNRLQTSDMAAPAAPEHAFASGERPRQAASAAALEAEMLRLEAAAGEELPPPPPAPPAMRLQSSRTRGEWERLIGGKLMNRIGALALIIGIGFFLKYAFDRNWLSETVRVLMGTGVGGALLAAGHRFVRREMPVFAQGLIGAGVAILYLCVYASFNYYHLVSQPVAFVLMTAVTVITFAEALTTNALAVSVLGWAGGFLTPFLLSTGNANMVGLFSYVTLLDAGLVLIVSKRSAWRVLEPLAIGATYLVYMFWHIEYFSAESLWLTLLFVTFFYMLFLKLDIDRLTGKRQEADPLAHVASIANTLFYLVALLHILEGEARIWKTVATLLLAGVSIVLMLVGRHRHQVFNTTEKRHAVATLFLAVIAAWIQLDGLTLAIALGIEAGIFFHLALRLNLPPIRGLSLALIAAALGVFVGALPILHEQGEFPLILNERMLATFVLAGVVFSAARALERQTTAGLVFIRGLLHTVWSVMLLMPITLEIFDLFTQGEPQHAFDAPFMLAVMAMSWIAYAALLFQFAAAFGYTTALHTAFWVALLSLLVALPQGFAYEPLADYRFLTNHRTLTLLVQAGGMFLLAHWVRKRLRQSWSPAVSLALQVAGVLAVVVLCTGETLDYFRKEIASFAFTPGNPAWAADVIQGLRDQQQLSLSGIWLLCAVALMVLGLRYRKRLFRVIAMVLSAVTVAKVFLVDLSFLNTLYRIFSFVGLGVILLVVSYLYQHYGDIILKDRPNIHEQEKSAT